LCKLILFLGYFDDGKSTVSEIQNYFVTMFLLPLLFKLFFYLSLLNKSVFQDKKKVLTKLLNGSVYKSLCAQYVTRTRIMIKRNNMWAKEKNYKLFSTEQQRI